MGHPVKEADDFADPRLTPEDIRATYQRMKRDGIDWKPYLPAKKDRRYIVVGGSGTVCSSSSH
jgi:hypothetical protein